jgi:hypothetical protein
MLAISDFVRHHGWTLLLLLGLTWLGIHQALKRPRWRIQFDAAFLQLPIVGRLATGYNTARFASTLAMLTSAGVPILKAMQSAADTLSIRQLEEYSGINFFPSLNDSEEDEIESEVNLGNWDFQAKFNYLPWTYARTCLHHLRPIQRSSRKARLLPDSQIYFPAH